MKIFKDKKVLLFGLGSLGGGVATAKWLFNNGAKLRITDFKKKSSLKKSLSRLKNIKASYILGRHRYQDIDWADYVIVNPGVSYKNDYINYALSKNKFVENDCSLFFSYAKGKIIAITGTRGKTTTTTWLFQLLQKLIGSKRNIILGGNQPEKGLLKIIKKTNPDSLAILELSSFQLEFYRCGLKAPKIAIITSIFNDHLNRYKNIQEYFKTKANIFRNQTKDDYLILNYDNQWTKSILKLKPKSQVYFVSLQDKLKNVSGIYYCQNHIFIKDNGKLFDLGNFKDFETIFGFHNLSNLLFVFLGCYLFFKSENKKMPKIPKKYLLSFKTPPYRQEIIYQDKKLLIVNDSASTSPDAVIVALKRFLALNKNLILIAGGTDKNLDFEELAVFLKNNLKPTNLVLLEGTATTKLINQLKRVKFNLFQENIFNNLKDCVLKSFIIAQKYPYSVIIFSPGSASFEKFKNEFERGKKFNSLFKKIFLL